MRIVRRSCVLAIAVLLAASAALGGAPTRGRQRALELFRELPRDPLVVLGTYVEDPAEQLRGLFDLLGKLDSGAEDGHAEGWRLFSEKIGMSLEQELLPHVGPEILLSIDLPALDDGLAALHRPDGGFAAMLGRAGIVTRVRSEKKVDEALRRVFAGLGGEVSEVDGLVRVDLPLPGDGPEAERPWLPVYYSARSHRLVLGFTPDWVRRGIAKRPVGERLTDGADFARVFGGLDQHPTDLTYVNLPRIRAYVMDSAIVNSVVADNARVREIVERFFNTEFMGVGLGSTSVVLENGVRTTYFGPHWMSGAAMSSGLVAAAALPSLFANVDHGRTERTVSDVEAIGKACEGFSSDSRAYPGPTEGWVPVERIAAFLEPVYIQALPRTDGWKRPLLYWSDGASYRVVSTGRDGTMDQDWSGRVEIQALADLDGDIVFGDGRLLVVPGR